MGARVLDLADQPDIVILIAPVIINAGVSGDGGYRAWQIAASVGMGLERLDSEGSHGCSGVVVVEPIICEPFVWQNPR